MPAVTILHLTDLHFGWANGGTEKADRMLALRGLISTLETMADPWRPQIICLTGDIGWRGSASDYAAARTWLQLLLSKLDLTPADLLVCAGNHDVDRSVAHRHPRPGDSGVADRCLARPLSEIATFGAFTAYNEFCAELGVRPYTYSERESHLVGMAEHRGIRFVAGNSAWYSQGDDDKDKLWIGQPHLKTLDADGHFPKTGDADVPPTVCLIHHPPDWWHSSETNADGMRFNTQDYLAQHCHMILSGHTHAERRKANRIAEGAYHLTGGAGYAGGTHYNSFRLIRIDQDGFEYRSFEFDPRSPDMVWQDRWGVQPLSFRPGPPVRRPVAQSTNVVNLSELRSLSRAAATRAIERKSRQIKSRGDLPVVQPLEVALRVSDQVDWFDHRGRLEQPKDTTIYLPLQEACRTADRRRTVLLGDLGTGKTTLAARLIGDLLDHEPHTFAFMVEAKTLRLHEAFTADELLTAVGIAFRAESAGAGPVFDMVELLTRGQEVFLLIDGLDEVPRPRASRILRQCEAVTETWSAIRVLATGRPIELTGIGYQDWTLCRLDRLRDQDRQAILEAEAKAAGRDHPREDAKRRLMELKRVPALDDLAATPLAVRLLYPRLGGIDGAPVSLGDLLYELLVERLGRWDEKDGKSGPDGHFVARFATPESRAPLLGELAIATKGETDVSAERVVAVFRHAGNLTHDLAQEAQNYFERIGIISVQGGLTFPYQPLLDVAVGLAWLERGAEILPDERLQSFWRGISFAAAAARRRGGLDRLRPRFEACLAAYLRERLGVPRAALIVSESQDHALAVAAVGMFAALGRKPVWADRENRTPSYRAIADTIRLAGDVGFDWFFREYLDPRFPIVHRGSAVPEEVFTHWAWLTRGSITDDQRRRLQPLVAPLIRCSGMLSLLPTLIHVVPDAFQETELLWYAARGMNDGLFSDEAESLFHSRVTVENRSVVREVLLRNCKPKTIIAYMRYFRDDPVPTRVVEGLIRWKARDPDDQQLVAIEADIRSRIGDAAWLAMLHWFLSDSNRNEYLAPAAALLLYDHGERRLPIIGEALLTAASSSFSGAEQRLTELLAAHGEGGIRWLIRRMIDGNDFMGAHESLWRILLAKLLTGIPDGPELLGQVLPRLGPFLLCRYPEVRHGFRQLLSGADGPKFHQALHERLLDPEPRLRHSAACVLAVHDPATEAEAVWEVVCGRGVHRYDSFEWEPFCLTLAFGPSVLAYLHGRMHELHRESRVLASAILHRHRYPLTAVEIADFFECLLQVGDHHLQVGADGRSYFEEDSGYEFLIGMLQRPLSTEGEEAAGLLLDFHAGRLSEAQAALAWSRTLARGRRHPEPTKTQILKVLDDPEYRVHVVKNHRADSEDGTTSLLTLVAGAAEEDTGWEPLTWALFCSASYLSFEFDDIGEILLDIARERPSHAKAIGTAAEKILDDPRVNNGYRGETRQWLAVLAHEFGNLDTADLERYTLADVVHVSALRALLVRMGRIPEQLPRGRYSHDYPQDLEQASNLPRPRDELMASLLSYGRTADQLHPDLCEAVENILLHPRATTEELTAIAQEGSTGALIAETLRFCYGDLPDVGDNSRLASGNGFPENWNTNSCFVRLAKTVAAARDTVMHDDPEWKTAFMNRLKVSITQRTENTSAPAVALMHAGGGLSADEVDRVFEDFARNHSRQHEELGRLLVRWPGLLDPDCREARLASVRKAINALLRRETRPTSAYTSPYPYMLFPLVEVAIAGTLGADSLKVYLTGLSLAVTDCQRSQGVESGQQVFAVFEPLLKFVSEDIWLRIRDAIAQWHDPNLRTLIAILTSLTGEPHNSKRPSA